MGNNGYGSLKNSDAREIGAEWLCIQVFDQLGIARFLAEKGWLQEQVLLALGCSIWTGAIDKILITKYLMRWETNHLKKGQELIIGNYWFSSRFHVLFTVI